MVVDSVVFPLSGHGFRVNPVFPRCWDNGPEWSWIGSELCVSHSCQVNRYGLEWSWI